MILGREGGNGAAVAGDTLMGLSWWWCVVIAWTTRLSIALLCSSLLFIALHCSALHCSALLVADVAGQGGGARDVGTIRARLAHDGWHAATVSMAEVTAVHASAILDVDRRRSTSIDVVLQTACSSRGVSSRHPLERFHSVCSKLGGTDWTISSKQTYLGSFQELGT
ncbi:MAG: hypothetical protein ABGY24_03075, partial [bacterium]